MRYLVLLLGMFAGVAMPSAVAAPPAAAPKSETIWWRTPGAGVVEFNHDRCSLLLYNADNAFVFTWQRSGTMLEVEDNAGRFPPATSVSAAVRIGQTWLGKPRNSGELNLTAVGDHALRAIALTQPILPLLKTARSAALHLADIEVRLLIDHGKMQALLAALRKCHAVIR